jgi:uncharacterized protein DUF6636
VRPRRPAALLALLVLTGLAAAAPATAKSRHFQTPSHKIACLYDSKGGPGPHIRCDALFLNDVAFFLDRSHKGKRRHATDTVADPNAKVLAYGKSLELGPFSCASRRTFLKCKSRESGHGFKLSRQSQKVF